MKAAIAAAAAGCALIVSGLARAEVDRPYADIMKEAQAAFAAEDYAQAAARLDEAQGQRPYSLFLTRNRILARVLAGDMAGAISVASQIAARGLTLDLPPHEGFDRLRADPGFALVAARLDENARPIGKANVVVEIAETGLLPEAIVRRGDQLLIGSVRTGAIYEVLGGALSELVRLDGGVFDIAVSDDGAAITAVINNQLAYEKTGARPAEAAIVKIGAGGEGAVSANVIESGQSLLGDLEADGGTLYASDSLTPRLIIREPGQQPRVFVEDPRFANLQGIALDARKRRLFVADYLTGLFVIDLKTAGVEKLANPTDAHLGGIDGLYLYKGDLIGIQNGTTPQRIVRIDLDNKGRVAKTLSVLQQALPEWNEPTHGFVDGGAFVYIATSNWPAYGDDGKPLDGKTLSPLRLMSVDLN